MKTYLTLKNEKRIPLPEIFRDDDVRYSESLVEFFLKEYTKRGDVVFDPFMGFGTTLLVAERMDRIGWGIEYDGNRARYVKSLLKHPERALQGDSMDLRMLQIPFFDFCITSPPYMGGQDWENPFTAYTTAGRGYQGYLEDIQHIFRQVGEKLYPGGHAVIEVSNLKHPNGMITPLAWDIAVVVSDVLRFHGEIVVAWEDGYGYGYDHSYCLLFSKK